jgi:hypothetical protein
MTSIRLKYCLWFLSSWTERIGPALQLVFDVLLRRVSVTLNNMAASKGKICCGKQRDYDEPVYRVVSEEKTARAGLP